MADIINKIESILKQQYDIKNFIGLIEELFIKIDYIAPDRYKNERSNFSSYIEGYNHIGNFQTSDNKKMLILAVELKKASYVENARSNQRIYAKKLIENANADAAFIAFYTKGEDKWRISFVRLDYELKFENGRLKTEENLTPAKRYSYLVGENEPCHTAVSRFEELISNMKNSTNYPTMNDLENIFSVEKVTDEFFKLYSEKYHQLREHLEANEDFCIEAQQHNFTSAQFAKKLMGQIVFLYFLQKKGWLGVSTWKEEIDEKQYKNAFYARGAKSRELIPVVYKPIEEGKYRLSVNGLKSLSDEDEEILAKCVIGSHWGSGPHDFMRRLFEYAEKNNKNFFDDVLEPLFYDALNVNRGEQGYCPALHCRIPFLSGGLFEPIDGYDWKYNNFNIPNDVFSNVKEKGREADGILDIFDRYNFTMSEDEPMEREIAIDPEMLGKVFENLLEVNDRKSKGAFYTPREIVHYMCQESLINYLSTTLDICEQDIRDFILYGDFMQQHDTEKTVWGKDSNGKSSLQFDYNKDLLISEKILSYKNNINRLDDIDNALKNIRVADPAVGSGAFPLGMLNEIVRARQTITAYKAIGKNDYEIRIMYLLERSPYILKRETIKNCIFAVDIDPSAVDITQLRLWLSLVIDDEINPNARDWSDGHKNPLPLPNFDSNILCGNSLINEFEGIKLINESELLGNVVENSYVSMNQSQIDDILASLIKKQEELYFCKDPKEKNRIKEEIASLRDILILLQLEGASEETIKRYHESKVLASKPYILWQLDFAKVFREKGGFDIFIGNPPYVDSENMVNQGLEKLRQILNLNYKCAKGNWDLFVIFIELGIELLSKNSIITYIVPNKLISAPYAKALRDKLAENQILEIRDYSDVKVFKEADVYPIVFRLKKSIFKQDVIMDMMKDIDQISSHNKISKKIFYKDTNWDKYFDSSEISLKILEKIGMNPELSTYATVNGAATVSEAYKIKEILFDDNNLNENKKRFINTGGIDKYKSLYGKESIRYIKGTYEYPVIKCDDLKTISLKRFEESCNNKIIIGGMNKVLECYYDKGDYLAGKSTTIVYNNENLKYIIACLNSKLMSFYYSKIFKSMSLAGGYYRIGVPQIKSLPIAFPKDRNVLVNIEKTVDKIQDNFLTNNDNGALELINDLDYIICSIYGLTKEETDYINKLEL